MLDEIFPPLKALIRPNTPVVTFDSKDSDFATVLDRPIVAPVDWTLKDGADQNTLLPFVARRPSGSLAWGGKLNTVSVYARALPEPYLKTPWSFHILYWVLFAVGKEEPKYIELALNF